MKSLFKFFAERHLLANVLTVMILLIGIASLFRINRTELPNADTGYVFITTRYPGASPEDVELNVTNKLEDALNSVTGIKNMMSASLENSSRITIEMDEDSDLEEVFDEIQDAVAGVTDLPIEVIEAPTIRRMKATYKPVLEVGISSETLSYAELREYAHQFEKKLLDVPGVAWVNKTGYRAREVRVEVSPDKMMKYQLSMSEIMRAIEGRNIRASGGSLESYTSEKNVVTLAKFEDPLEVGDVIVRSSPNGAMVYVKDLAVIRDDFEEDVVIPRINGKTTISFRVTKNENTDIIRTVDAVKALVEEEKSVLPDSIEFLFTDDESIGVRNKLDIVKINGMLGLVLVLVMLALFLNVRSSFWVAMGIPVSLMGVFMLMPLFDVELDSLTMSAMVIVIGIIVDDAIVIAENIFQRREKGEGPLEAAVNGLHEVALPVFTTIATTILAFLPMFYIKGMIGRFVYVVPLTVILALSMSMLESFLILPAHLLPGLQGGKKQNFGRIWFRPVRDRFERVIYGILKLRYMWVVVACAILVGSLLYARNTMGFKLFDRGKNATSITATIEMPVGTSLEATSDKMREIEAIVESLPEGEVESYFAQIGTGGRHSNTSAHLATLSINMTPQSERQRPFPEILSELRQKTSQIQGIESLSLGVEASGPPTGKPVEVMIKGADDSLRSQLAADVASFLQTLDGLSDIERDDKTGKEEIAIRINYPLLAHYGLSVADIAQNVRIAYDGQVATRTRYGDEDIDFRVILQEEYRQDINYLRQLKIPNRQGELINLEEVASLDIEPNVAAFYHDEGERTITLTAEIDEKVTTPLEVMRVVQSQFDFETMKAYSGMRIEIGGEAKDTQRALRDILTSFALAALGIYFLLMLLFNSPTQPLMVILAIPFGVAGVIIAFALHGLPQITSLAAIGVVGMAGVVVNDALVLVNHLNDLKRRAANGSFANMATLIASGTADRFRPVILTTVTTVAGLMPLVYGIGGEDAMMGPMAMALGYGLLFATPVTLILLPCLYMIGYDIQTVTVKVKQGFHREKSPELIPQLEEA